MKTETFKIKKWSGRILSGLAFAFLLFDAAIKFFMDKLPPEALKEGESLQWPIERMPLVGTILLLCLFLYLIPRTSVIGAVLLTGYLGGAVASHIRVNSPAFTHTLFPIYVAFFVWFGLYLRDNRVKALLEKNN